MTLAAVLPQVGISINYRCVGIYTVTPLADPLSFLCIAFIVNSRIV